MTIRSYLGTSPRKQLKVLNENTILNDSISHESIISKIGSTRDLEYQGPSEDSFSVKP